MPYGNVSFVIRLFPLHPGYTMIECADATAAKATVRSVDESILRMGLVLYVVRLEDLENPSQCRKRRFETKNHRSDLPRDGFLLAEPLALSSVAQADSRTNPAFLTRLLTGDQISRNP